MTESPSRLTRLRHRSEDLVVGGVSMLLRRASMTTVRAWGMALGRMAYRVAGSRRRIAVENLAHAFPQLSPTECERIARATFEHFGRMLLEVIRFGTLSHDEIRALCDVDGEQHVLSSYAAGNGIIFLAAHLGFWEMQGISNPLSWRPISVVARPLDNPWLHARLEHIRTRTGNEVIYRQGSVRRVLRALGANRGVAILIDQHLNAQDALRVNFFGRPAATTAIVASLVLRTGAAVVPAFGLPLPGGRYRMVYGRPVEPPSDDSPAAVLDFTQRCTNVIEACVREHPELWLWMHRRWRESPAVSETAETEGATAASASKGNL